MENHTVNSLKLGSGSQALVLLHGWGRSLEQMKPLGQLLTPLGQVHLIDLPGFGNSPVPASDWGSIEYSEAIVSYLDQQQLSRVFLIGHSFGGKVSIRLASRHPERIARLVLISSSGLKRMKTPLEEFRSKLISHYGKLLKVLDKFVGTSFFKNYFVERFGSADYKNAGPMKNILVKSVHEDLSQDAAKVSAETLLIWGDKDKETPLEMAQRFSLLIPKSRLLVLSGKGHDVFAGAGSHLIAHHLMPFLRVDSK